ncbi:uncharacterized protein [Eucyclogobius newberryi]|uniref:uncharacterized protein n=1 Tax=Eucyclogobius newberryi TaxID=166745 RepID=UPI003B5C8908
MLRHEHLGRHACSTKEPESEHAAHNPTNVTLKSYECDGGEVEIADELVEKADDTIPLPQPGLREQQTLDHSNVLDATDDCDIEGERADHLYYRRERGGKALQDKPADALCDVTLKSLNCTGGEIEIANSVNPDDQTIPLPTDQSGKDVDPCIDSVDSALFTEEGDHGDHLYCDVRAEDHFCVTNEASDQDLSEKKDLTDKQADCKDVSLLCSELDNESSNGSMEAASFVTEPQSRRGELASDGVLKQTDNPTEENNSLRESLIIPDIMVAPPSEDPSPNTGQSEKGQQQSQLDLSSSIASSQRSTHDGHHNATAAPSYPDVGEGEPHVCSSVPTGQANDATDSALGSSANAAPVSGEQSRAETLPDVFMAISERAPFLTPIVRRASLAYARAREELAAGQSLQRPGGLEDAEFWREHLDSPIPRPLFNSTELVRRSQTCIAAGASEGPSAARPGADDEPVAVVPVMPADPLQQQLRQVAEFLMLASGKMGHVHVPAPAATPPKAERHSACVGTTPMKMVNHSVNTSGQFEKRRSFSLVDQSTLTDPLLWNVSVGSLQNVPRPELEQRLLSSMIIVEALVQQSAAACVEALPTTGAALSELRERAVQTEHTELCQTSMHRDLYLEALNRIKELEMDATSLQELVQYMQNVKTNMNVLTSDTDAALGQMKQIGEVVREDHNILVSNYAQMRSLLEKSRASQVRMLQKVKEALQQREDMSTQMEQARSAKDSADSVMVQLRKHCSGEISELEKCVGSQQELLSALQRAHPEQVALNKAYSETLNSALELLSKTTEEQSRLGKELCAARRLLQKCTPTLLRLNKKADAALRERDQQIAERNQAIHDKEQTEDELNQALCNLQAANEQIGDLNLQVTILTSEMGVLRHKLSEGDEERAQLDRKATELSATVSSTLASYAFLEQALASETTKLQQSWADIKHVKDWAQDLESSLESSLERLEQSERRASELSAALAHSEGRVSELQSLCETRALQLQQLRETCGQLGGVQEENEFLQMENELSREQAVESERLLRANLQSLRERNIQCEDLNAELYLLRHANQNLQEELDCVRTELSSSQMEHKEKLDQMATEIAILHHVVRSTADELRENGENSDEPSPDNISSSFAPATEAEHCPGPTLSN